jgi:hypothetical protein
VIVVVDRPLPVLEIPILSPHPSWNGSASALSLGQANAEAAAAAAHQSTSNQTSVTLVIVAACMSGLLGALFGGLIVFCVLRRFSRPSPLCKIPIGYIASPSPSPSPLLSGKTGGELPMLEGDTVTLEMLSGNM